MGYWILNLISLVLGLMAWGIPGVMLVKQKSAMRLHWIIYSIISLIACTLALLSQIAYQWHLSDIEDFTAISDTMGALLMVSTVLVVVTIWINSLYISKNYER